MGIKPKMYLRKIAGKSYRKIKNVIYKPNPNAILLFGLNKSGTSATINLIAHSANISILDDFPYKLGDWDDVVYGKENFIKYLNKHGYAFSKDLIRFPMNQQAIDFASSYFLMNKYIVTIRNPIDNIKSILSRLKLPGDLESLDVSKLNYHSNWIKMLNRKPHYIDSLIDCWNEAYSINEIINCPNAVIFKYEDFIDDKETYISQKVHELDLKPKNSIKEFVNVQYQPKGTGQNNLEFFGERNLSKIVNQTKPIAKNFGYDLNNY